MGGTKWWKNMEKIWNQWHMKSIHCWKTKIQQYVKEDKSGILGEKGIWMCKSCEKAKLHCNNNN